ncbi:hypothetical protein MAR_020457 [Mya arenaria]|uniref:Uncharacterized protein n=1 Tax=Mya arenaria TaxID=6604 RepID=A0ABY7E4Z8_MYAAR|nr:hypothetical protein MAR_020457 [Mya arenaria]
MFLLCPVVRRILTKGTFDNDKELINMSGVNTATSATTVSTQTQATGTSTAAPVTADPMSAIVQNNSPSVIYVTVPSDTLGRIINIPDRKWLVIANKLYDAVLRRELILHTF